MYNINVKRVPQFLAIAEALKRALEDRSPKDANGDIIPVKTHFDDAELTQYSVPSLVIIQTGFQPDETTKTCRPVYKDFNYTDLTVKEFPEPIHGKLQFEVHTAAQNPDNDLLLQTFMLRVRRTIGEVHAKLVVDDDQYDRIVLFWHKPEDFNSEDESKVRVYPVDAWVHLEFLEYQKRSLIETTNPVVVTIGNYYQSSFYRRATLAHPVVSADSIVYTVENLRHFPMAGIVEFEDGSTFQYANKTYNSLLGVTGISGYHCFGETIRVRSEV